MQRPFYERWRMIEKEIVEPRNYERQHMYQSQNPHYRYDLEPFRVCNRLSSTCSCNLRQSEFFVCLTFVSVQVRRKDFWLLSTVTKLLKGFIPNLCHDADGLIFQVLGRTETCISRTFSSSS